MKTKNVKLYGDITKSEEQDDGTVKVWGYASSASKDIDGEIITADAMKAALPDYMKFANVREMHTAKAAGVAIEAEVQADGRTFFGAHIIDSEAVKKVRAGVYKGFSIGGRVTSRDLMNKSIINGLLLTEVSLVDRPANPEATFTFFKADGLDDDIGTENLDADVAKTETTVTTVTTVATTEPAVPEPVVETVSITKAEMDEFNALKLEKAKNDIAKLQSVYDGVLQKLTLAVGAKEGDDVVAAVEDLVKRIKELESKPAPNPATLKVVDKAQDFDDATLEKSDNHAKPKTPEDIMKSIHTGGRMFMTASGLRRMA